MQWRSLTAVDMSNLAQPKLSIPDPSNGVLTLSAAAMICLIITDASVTLIGIKTANSRLTKFGKAVFSGQLSEGRAFDATSRNIMVAPYGD